MNDLTKKELRDIQHYIEAYYDYNPKGNLHNKIQSMIDNYQEIKKPTMANYCCPKCNEEWRECECKNE